MSRPQDPITSVSTWLGHPSALFALVFMGAAEHFAFFGVRGLLVSYLGDPIEGPSWGYRQALMLFSAYSFATYAAYIPGGLIADKLTGAKGAVLIGGLLSCAGCALLALGGTYAPGIGVALVALGAGLTRPALWTMVARNYAAGDARRDTAFSVLFVVGNLGAALSGLLVSSVGHEYGWSYGFALAGAGLALGLGAFASMWRSFPRTPTSQTPAPLTKVDRQRVSVVGLTILLVSLSAAAYDFAMTPLLSTSANIDADRLGLVESMTVLVLALPLAYFLAACRRRGRKSSSLLKIAIGILLTAFGVLSALPFMLDRTLGTTLSWGWVVFPLLTAVGTLLIVPVSWSFVSKLAPKRYASTTMAVFLMATSLLSPLVFFAVEHLGEAESTDPASLVVGATVFCALLGASVIAALKPLKRLTHDAEG